MTAYVPEVGSGVWFDWWTVKPAARPTMPLSSGSDEPEADMSMNRLSSRSTGDTLGRREWGAVRRGRPVRHPPGGRRPPGGPPGGRRPPGPPGGCFPPREVYAVL